MSRALNEFLRAPPKLSVVNSTYALKLSTDNILNKAKHNRADIHTKPANNHKNKFTTLNEKRVEKFH
jgi:hypothetical protein